MNEPAVALREVAAARFVLALREGGSLPGLIEGDDGRLWVAKFRGAGQGAGALVAEVVAGALARSLGLPMPELVVLTLPPRFGVTDGDPEGQRWLAFLLPEDGTIGAGGLLFDAATLQGLGGPDGLVVDKDGVIFGAGFEGVFVFTPEGTHLGSIFPGSLTSNVAWGDDGSSLFITADQRLLRLRTTTRGGTV